MNTLPFSRQVEVLSLLIEGGSLRAIARLTGVDRNTIMRVNRRVGEACHRLHHARMRDLQCARLEMDETWSFIGKRQKNLQDGDPSEYGDIYVWAALDVHTRLIISYLVGSPHKAGPKKNHSLGHGPASTRVSSTHEGQELGHGIP